jgi:hypothetical protein
MTTPFDKNLLPGFDSVKDANEQVLWTVKPRFIPFILSGLGNGLFILLFGVVFIVGGLSTVPKEDPMTRWFWIFGLLSIGQGLIKFIGRILSFSNTQYAYSDKRVMIRTGFFGTDFKAFDYDKISDIEVTVNVIERLYNVGTVRFYSGRTQTNDDGTTKLYDTWSAINDPYAVFKQVKQVAVDVKTDHKYPNALRPDTNPGYNTKYDRRS